MTNVTPWCRRPLLPLVLPSLAALVGPVLAFNARGLAPLLILTALCALIDMVRLGHLPKRPFGPLVAVAALLAWGLASALWEETAGLAVAKTLQLAGLTLCGVALTTETSRLTQPTQDRMLAALGWGIVAAVLIVLIEWRYDLQLARWRYHLPKISGAINIGIYKNLGAAGIVFAVPVVGFALLRRRWILAASVAAAIVVVSVVTRSQTGVVALAAVVGLALSAVLWRRLPVLLLAALVAGVFLSAPLARDLPPSERLAVEQQWMPPSLVHRTVIWHFVAEHAAERPILGWGLDAARELPGGDQNVTITAFFHGETITFIQQILPLHPHNFVLQLWLELGAVGMVLFLVLFGLLLRHAWKQADWWGVACTCTLAVPVVVGGASYGLWQSWWVSGLWLLAAFVTGLSSRPLGSTAG